jgi:hypothetical protein
MELSSRQQYSDGSGCVPVSSIPYLVTEVEHGLDNCKQYRTRKAIDLKNLLYIRVTDISPTPKSPASILETRNVTMATTAYYSVALVCFFIGWRE